MKAVIYTEFGSPDVLQLAEVDQPAPKPNEVQVRVRAASVNFGDTFARDFGKVTARTFTMPGLLLLPTKMTIGFSKPKIRILGNEFAGEVAAVGSEVTRFKVGDRVFGYRSISMGAHAEYLCVPEKSLIAPMPANMSFAEAAAVPYGALTALSLLRTLKVQRGQKVLINGASGSIGSYAVQVARYFGAEVTGVCSTPRLEMVKALGAVQVIDYTREDFTRNGERYDLILDVMGKSSFERCKAALTPTGIYALVSFKTRHLLQMLATSMSSGKKVKCVLSGESLADLVLIKDLIEDGKLISIVDQCFPLEQAADAHRRAESKDKKGGVVMTVGA